MLSSRDILFLLGLLLFTVAGVLILRKPHSVPAKSPLELSSALLTTRSSPSDLEISGDLAHLPPGSTRFITRETLLALPQTTTNVSDDANFHHPVKISGVSLEELSNRLSQSPASAMVTADCDDLYQAHYPREAITTHHPILVLQINDQPPANWPKSSESALMGPYLISHPKFTPAFQAFQHTDEPQIPWGVIRLEFRNEESVFGPIAPPPISAADPQVRAGFLIAKQNCLRCHNTGEKSGMKSGIPWQTLVAWAAASPAAFASYIRAPQSVNSKAQMPGNPKYDGPTLDALTAYFTSLSNPKKPCPFVSPKCCSSPAFYTFVVFNNLTGYNSNFKFIRKDGA
jgi:mono/diheme cytochrome c family protein